MRRPILLLLVLAVAAATGCTSAKGKTVEEKRASVLSMEKKALADLYRQRPELEKKVESAPGYGVFSNIGTNIIFVTTGNGYGVVVDNETGERTYMKMAEVGVGIGLGVKDFRAVFVFNNPRTLQNFIYSGWEFGAEAEATAKSGEKGGAADTAGSIGSGIEVYQLTESGVALQANVAGTKYWPDKALNAE